MTVAYSHSAMSLSSRATLVPRGWSRTTHFPEFRVAGPDTIRPAAPRPRFT